MTKKKGNKMYKLIVDTTPVEGITLTKVIGYKVLFNNIVIHESKETESMLNGGETLKEAVLNAVTNVFPYMHFKTVTETRSFVPWSQINAITTGHEYDPKITFESEVNIPLNPVEYMDGSKHVFKVDALKELSESLKELNRLILKMYLKVTKVEHSINVIESLGKLESLPPQFNDTFYGLHVFISVENVNVYSKILVFDVVNNLIVPETACDKCIVEPSLLLQYLYLNNSLAIIFSSLEEDRKYPENEGKVLEYNRMILAIQAEIKRVESELVG